MSSCFRRDSIIDLPTGRKLARFLVMAAVGLLAGWISGQHKLYCLNVTRFAKIQDDLSKEEVWATEEEASVEDVMMIGVISTQKNLASRATAIYTTWGGDVPGRIVFYVGQTRKQKALDMKKQNVTNAKETVVPGREPVKSVRNLPVVELSGVDDSDYPPRDKSFAMLRHMQHNFGSRYQWFLRCDDDVFIRPRELAMFLNSVNNSRLLYIGHPFLGAQKTPLGLDRAYCMGGAGMVFSPPTLRRVVPHLPQCAGSVASDHEDTEVGRCVSRFAGVSCMYSRKRGMGIFRHGLRGKSKEALRETLASVLTFHPVRSISMAKRLYLLTRGQDIKVLENRKQRLRSDLNNIDDILLDLKRSAVFKSSPTSKKRNGSNSRSVTRDTKGVISNTLFDASRTSALRNTKDKYTVPLRSIKVIGQRDRNTSNTASFADGWSVWDYIITQKQKFVLDPSRDCSLRDFIINKTEQRIRSFAQLKELDNSFLLKQNVLAKYQSLSVTSGLQQQISYHSVKGTFWSYRLSSRFEPLQWREVDYWYLSDLRFDADKSGEDGTTRNGSARETAKGVTPPPRPLAARKEEDDEAGMTSSWPTLHVVLSLHERRHRLYPPFMTQLRLAAEGYPGSVQLHVRLSGQHPGPDHQHGQRWLEASGGQERGQRLVVSVVRANDSSKPTSDVDTLDTLARALHPAAVVIVVPDVGLRLGPDFLLRAAANVGSGRAYLPLPFALYSPVSVCYGGPPGPCRPGASPDSLPEAGRWLPDDALAPGGAVGGGAVAVALAGDVEQVGESGEGADVTEGQGGDVGSELYRRWLSRGLDILQAPDPGVVRASHNESCDQPGLTASQRARCRLALYNTFGSVSSLAHMWTDSDHALRPAVDDQFAVMP